MSSESDSLYQAADTARWIAEVRNGNAEALDRLLALCRPYLPRVANEDLGAGLLPRLTPSAIVHLSLREEDQS